MQQGMFDPILLSGDRRALDERAYMYAKGLRNLGHSDEDISAKLEEKKLPPIDYDLLPEAPTSVELQDRYIDSLRNDVAKHKPPTSGFDLNPEAAMLRHAQWKKVELLRDDDRLIEAHNLERHLLNEERKFHSAYTQFLENRMAQNKAIGYDAPYIDSVLASEREELSRVEHRISNLQRPTGGKPEPASRGIPKRTRRDSLANRPQAEYNMLDLMMGATSTTEANKSPKIAPPEIAIAKKKKSKKPQHPAERYARRMF